jgi:hypothetical protein
MGWSKDKKWKIKYECSSGAYTFEYDTAKELGELVRDSGCRMPNPYEPDNTDYDDFNGH